MDHDAALVDAHRDRHRLPVEQVELVDEERPVEPPPLPVQAQPVEVLLLRDADSDQRPGLDVRREQLLPPGQDPPAARSP
jgi:hypothetical protein